MTDRLVVEQARHFPVVEQAREQTMGSAARRPAPDVPAG